MIELFVYLLLLLLKPFGCPLRMLSLSLYRNRSRERRMFDTVRNVNEASKRRLRNLSPLPIPGSNQMSAFGSNQSGSFPSPRSSYYGSETSPTCSGATNRSLDMDMSIEGLVIKKDMEVGRGER